MSHTPVYTLTPLEILKMFVDNFEPCGSCDGAGLEPNDPASACHNCGGTGLQVTSYGELYELESAARAAIAKAEGKE